MSPSGRPRWPSVSASAKVADRPVTVPKMMASSGLWVRRVCEATARTKAQLPLIAWHTRHWVPTYRLRCVERPGSTWQCSTFST